jgi:hypothetical protein
MKLWYDPQDGRAILELPTVVPGLELELLLYFSDDGTRAIWVWSRTRRIAWWPPVGMC